MGVDKKAFRSLSYGLYIVTAEHEGVAGGCVVNTFTQLTSSPFQVTVALNKENVTTGLVKESGRFVCTVLGESASMELIGAFGFRTSTEFDKFNGFTVQRDGAGVPYVTDSAVARFSMRVVNVVDAGTHLLFIGEVEEGEVLGSEDPMTYAYYHQVKGGKTPPKASSYVGDGAGEQPAASEAAKAEAEAPAAEKRYGWQCTVCGYIVEMDELPDDYECPVCGVGKEMFERVEL